MYLCGGEASLIELGRFNLPVAQPTPSEKGQGERPGFGEGAMVEGARAGVEACLHTLHVGEIGVAEDRFEKKRLG